VGIQKYGIRDEKDCGLIRGRTIRGWGGREKKNLPKRNPSRKAKQNGGERGKKGIYGPPTSSEKTGTPKRKGEKPKTFVRGDQQQTVSINILSRY